MCWPKTVSHQRHSKMVRHLAQADQLGNGTVFRKAEQIQFEEQEFVHTCLEVEEIPSRRENILNRVF